MKKAFLALLLSSFIQAAEKPRNVVFILVDDLGVTDIDIDGSDPFYETPNLETNPLRPRAFGGLSLLSSQAQSGLTGHRLSYTGVR